MRVFDVFEAISEGAILGGSGDVVRMYIAAFPELAKGKAVQLHLLSRVRG